MGIERFPSKEKRTVGSSLNHQMIKKGGHRRDSFQKEKESGRKNQGRGNDGGQRGQTFSAP